MPRDRTALSLGAVVVLFSLFGLRVVPASVRHLMAEHGRLEAERALLLETESAMARLPTLEDSAHALTAEVASLAPRLLSGTSAPAALSDLSGRLTTLLTPHHVSVVEVTAVPDSSRAGPLRRLSAEVRLQTDFRGLADILAVLARDSVTTVAERVRIIAPEPVMPEAPMEQLDVRMLLTAWYLTGGRTGGDRSALGSRKAATRREGVADSRPVGPTDGLIRFASSDAPFRASRLPPRLRFGVAPPPVPVVEAVSKPAPILTGILWGSQPAAILESMPGQEGAVVLRRGESVGALQVVRIERQRVLLSGFDTTWTLTVRQPWP